MKVYDDAWGTIDVLPYKDLAPQVHRLRAAVLTADTLEALRRQVDELIAPLEALLRLP